MKPYAKFKYFIFLLIVSCGHAPDEILIPGIDSKYIENDSRMHLQQRQGLRGKADYKIAE
jgi:hypothetical protein